MNKDISVTESRLEKLVAERYDIFKRCKMDDIQLPLLGGNIDDVPMDDTERLSVDQSDMSDGTSSTLRATQTQMTVAAIEVNFDILDEELKRADADASDAKFTDRIKEIATEIDRMAPNLKAIERLDGVETRLKATAEEFEQARK